MPEKVLTMEELKELLEATAEKKIEEKFDELKRLLENRPTAENPQGKELTPEERIAKFFKAVFEHDTETVKSLGFGVNGGQYLVPREFVAMVIEKLPLYTAVRKVATVYPAKSLAGTVPIENEGSAYWVGEFEEPDDAGTSISQLEYALKKLMSKIPVSNDLLEYSDVDLVNFLTKSFAKSIARAEDKAFTVGDGNKKPVGFATETITTITDTAMNYDKLVKLKNTVPVEFQDNAVFMTSQRGVELLEGLKDNNGRPILTTALDGRLKLFGKDVIVNKYIPANLGTSGNGTEIYYGDFSAYYIFDGKQMTVKTADRPEIDAQIFVARFLVDGKLAYTDGLAKLVIAD